MQPVVRLVRRLVVLGLGLLALVVLAVWVASRTGTVQELVRRQVLAALERALDAEITLGGVGGTLGRSMIVRDLRLAVHGRTVLTVPRAEIVYALAPLFRGHVHLRRVTLESPRVRAVRTSAGWRLPAARPGEGGGQQREVTIRLDRLEVRDGRIGVTLVDGSRIRRFAATGLQLTAAASIAPDRRRLRLAALDLVPRGIALSPLHATGELASAGDLVVVRNLDVATARSHIVGGGTVARGRTVDARVALVPLDAGEVRAVVPSLRLRTTVHAVASAVGPWDAVRVGLRAACGPGGRAGIAGTADLAADPPAYDLIARVAGLDPGAILDGLVRADLHGRARASGAGTGLRAPIRYAARLAPSRLAGRPLDRLAVDGAATDGVHRATVQLAAPAGTAAARVRLALASRPRYRLAGRLALERVEALVPALPGHATARVSLIGTGTETATRRARLRARLADGALRGVALAGGDLRARLDGQRVRVTRLEVEGPAVRASGSAMVALDARTAEAEAEAALRLAPLGVADAGTATLEARASGAFDALAVTAAAGVRDLRSSRASLERADATLALTDLGAAAPSGGLHLDAAGVRTLDAPPRDLTSDVDWRHAGETDHLTLTLTGRQAGDVTERAAVALARTPARTTGELRELLVTPQGQTPWQLARPAGFEILDDSFRTVGIALVAGAQRVTFAGRVGLHGPHDATLDASGVEVATLCTLTAGPPCGGELGGRVTLTGTAADPRLAASLTARSVRVETVEYGDVHLELGYVGLRADLRATLRHPEAGELRLDGSVPIDLGWNGVHPDLRTAPVDLRLHAARLDLTFLRALAPHELRQSAGRITLDVRIGGPRAAPRGDGHIALTDGRIEIAAVGVPYEEVRAELVLAGDTLEVRALHARAGGGSLDGTGRIGLAGDRTLDLSVRLDDFLALRRDVVEAQASGTLAVRGTLASPDVRGTLEVQRGIVRPAALPASGPPLDRDATITVVGRPEPAVPPPSPAARLAEALRLDVEIGVPRNVWIRRADASIELGGELRAQKAAGEPLRLIGTIRLLRGWYAFQGRRFTIEEGTIRFTGATPPEPRFDITATSRSGEYRIIVRVEGSSKKPTLKLTSDPPLEQADILSVILFGKPATELGRRESVGLQRQAIQLASGYVAPELRTSVMNTLGLDVLDVELQEGSESASRVTLGRYVASDVFVSLGQEFGARTAEVLGVEYGLTRRISVKGSTSTRGDSAVDLFWHRRY